ncbi:Pre-mRNA splicing Prp18-interacting factor-domain-containing protein [Elsinoe ampelina]|uniref:Pre-mRNA-splicing factor SLU7 n=1 Tax=Elsinoe ampelina TaxID=302913 RepID=A0A6A6GIK6_9PEZI|nr:Pre-mRNA splicing Prp18-interacting factor-domain-containing protein [Elsinoe ampelina]
MPPPPPKPTDDPKKDTERNEYIPSFISKKPFYIDDATASQDDYLEHQRLQSQKNLDPIATSKWYDRGKKVAPAATKYRKGACENCGAMTHKVKDCLQRKRKHGARWTGKDIQADEVVQDVKLGWDAKRDRWNGFDAKEYDQVVEQYNALEEVKKQTSAVQGQDDEERAAAIEDGDKYEAETDMGRQQPTSTRNLRLREDTAKYLLNLDLESSAKYDPKTRSLIEQDPTGADAGDGFEAATGDAAEFERAQKYAWERQERGDKDAVNLQANPTAGEIGRKKQEKEALEKKEAQRKALLEKYGGQEHLQKDPLKNVSVTENEKFVEYDAKGRLKGLSEKKEKSMYAEDVHINNHTSVWGSWWKDFKWGYACCHSTVKNSYCVGEEGRKAIEESAAFSRGDMLAKESAASQSVEVPKVVAEAEGKSLESHVPNAVDRPEKVRSDEGRGKRTYEEMSNGVSAEDVEEYRRSKAAKDDPMAQAVDAV